MTPFLYLGFVAAAALVDGALQLEPGIPRKLALCADFYGGYGLSAPACPFGTDSCSGPRAGQLLSHWPNLSTYTYCNQWSCGLLS